MRSVSFLVNFYTICIGVTTLFVIGIGSPSYADSAVRLTDVTTTYGGGITSFLISGDHAVALARDSIDGASYLLSVATDGSLPPTALNGPSVSGTDPLYVQSYRQNPDDPESILFYGPNSFSSMAESVYYKVSAAGMTPPVELTDIEQRIYFDSQTLEEDYSHEYVVRPDVNGIRQVYRVPLLDAGLESPITAHTRNGTNVETPALAPGDRYVLYRSDAATPLAYELYSVPTDGSAPAVRLNLPLPATADVLGAGWTSDGLRTVFRVVNSAADTRHLYITATDGSSPVQQLNLAPEHEEVRSWQFTHDEERVLYITGPSNSTGGGLYSVSISNPTADHYRISSEGANIATAVYGARITASGDRVIYDGFLNTGTSVDLFSASTTQPGTEIQLNTRHIAFGDVSSIALIHGGDRVVYRGDMHRRGFYDIYVADTDQAGSQIRISGPVASNVGSIFSYSLSSDEEWVVYGKTSPGQSAKGLYSASTSAADSERTLIYHDLFTQTQVSRISPDSLWVVAEVQTRSADNLLREWLFAVPINGGVPVRLNAPLPIRGAINGFQFSPDGNSLIYAADRVIREVDMVCTTGGRGQICQPGEIYQVYIGDDELYASQLTETGGLLGDMNGNGEFNIDDAASFALGILNPQNFAFQYGLTPVNFGDINQDGFFDLLDVGPFAALLGVPESTILRLIPEPTSFVLVAATLCVLLGCSGRLKNACHL